MSTTSSLHLTAGTLARSQAIWVVGLIFALMTFLSPLDDAANLPLGELSTETYAFVAVLSAPAVVFLFMATKSFRLPRDLTVILVLIVMTILVSIAANMPSILSAATKGRQGLEKAISSSLVPMLGMYVAMLTCNVVPYDFRKYFLTPVLAGSGVVAAVALLQVASNYVGSLQGVSDRIYSVTHHLRDGGAATNSGPRLIEVSSVLFEPADFGTYVIYVAPWLLAALLVRESNYGRTLPVIWKKLAMIAILAALFVAVRFSGRTASLGAPVMAAGYVGLCLVAWLSFHRLAYKIMCWIVIVVAVLAYVLPVVLVLLFEDEIVTMVVATRSESNITRFGTVVILLELFQANPFFGAGMGQYGFYVAQYIPSWANTYEFQRWLGSLNSSFFPSFAVFARLAGELGVFALATWVGFLVVMLNRVFTNLRVSYFSSSGFPYYGVALATNFFSIAVSGMGMASFRVFWLWTTIGLASVYAMNPQCIDMRQPARPQKPDAARRFAELRRNSLRQGTLPEVR
jgi:hypothetical protein